MTPITPSQFVEDYLGQSSQAVNDLGRLITKPCGLDAHGMIATISDSRLGRFGIPMMADFMAPDESVYYDAIFGAYHGQLSIRGWLVPAMAEIEFIDFVPTAEPVVFEDGLGGTSLDEWEMVASIGDDKIPLAPGVSVRRYRDGFITWACDVYDTNAFRQPPPPDSGIEATPIPPWPRVDWSSALTPSDSRPSDRASAWIKGRPWAEGHASGLTDRDLHEILTDPTTADDVGLLLDLLHPDQATYYSPSCGRQVGRGTIREVVAGNSQVVGGDRQPLGPALFDGTVSVQEWQRECLCSDATTVVIRGTSVRRLRDGWITYAADYFDTAPFHV